MSWRRVRAPVAGGANCIKSGGTCLTGSSNARHCASCYSIDAAHDAREIDMNADPDLVASPLVLRFSAVVGVSADELVKAAGLSVNDAGFTHADGMHLWSTLERLTGDPHVGLRAASVAKLDFMGMLGLAFASSRDLADGLRLLERTIPVLIRNARFTAVFEPQGGGVVYEGPGSEVRHGVESLIAGVLHLARECTRHRLVPTRVSLQSAQPRSLAPYEAFFGRAPTFDAPACALWFSPEDLQRPFGGADPSTASVLVAHAPALLAAPARAGFLEQVEHAIRRSLEENNGSLADVAQRLGQSVRTLQRRLSEHGQTFPSMRRRAMDARVDQWLDPERPAGVVHEE